MAVPAPQPSESVSSSQPQIQRSPEISVVIPTLTDKLRYLAPTNRNRVQGKIEELPCADDSFDGAVASQVLGMPSSTTQALREINRILKPGAPVVFAVPDCRRLGWRIIGFLYRRLPNVKQRAVPEYQFSRSQLVDFLTEHGFRALKYRYILGAELVLKAQKVESLSK